MNIYMDLYRTRLYLPLIVLMAAFIIFNKNGGTAKSGKYIDKISDRLIALILGCLGFGICALLIYSGKSWGGDFSQFFAQARALATGTVSDWYVKNQFIIDNSCDGIGADVYPWLWAIVLAPVYRFLGYFPYTPLKLLECLFVAGTVATEFYIYKRRMTKSSAVILTFFTLFSVIITFNVNTIEADIVCMFMVIETLNIVDLYNSEESKKKQLLLAGLLGLFLFLSVATKTMAEGTVLALICYDLLLALTAFFEKAGRKFLFRIEHKGGRTWYIRLVPYFVYILLTKILEAVLPAAGGTYNGYFTPTVERIRYGIVKYFGIFKGFFGDDCRPIISVILAVVVVSFLITAILGMIVAFRKDTYAEIYSCGMIFMLLIYNYYRSGFAFTFYPILIMFSFHGLSFVLEKVPGLKDAYVIQTLVFGLIVLMAAQTFFLIYNVRFKGYGFNDIDNQPTYEIFEYIDENIGDDEVVHFFRPRVLYYFTNVNSYTSGDVAEDLGLADYVLLDNWNNEKHIEEAVLDDTAYELIFSNDVYRLWKKK
ncbi:hypothetical protein [Butyrivibrio sp. MC2021]|uniref:hypothetical protein n=1 Tax=Butyrivibrio sp. MC2021 TaxID=1408306 RepID=UPI00047C1D4A|nr:hypothetical protein [Butyrivibrio sp. MC2021]